MNKYKVLSIETVLPNYRLPFFLKLSESASVDLEVAFGDSRPSNSLQSVRETGTLKIQRVSNVFIGKKGLYRFQRGALGLVLSRKYDAIIADFDIRVVSNMLACVAAKFAGVRFIWWGHGIGHKKHWLSKMIRLALCRISDAIIFYDDVRADYFVKAGVPAPKTFVAWNSVDTESIRQYAHPFKNGHRNRVTYLGRLIPEKKCMMLLESFAIAKPQLPKDIVLTFIGDGPERNALVQKTKDLGLGQSVEIVGSLFGEKELSHYFNTSLLSVCCGYGGLNIIHSFAYSVPHLIANDEPHSPEISAMEEGGNGYYFQSDNSVQLAEMMVRLINNPEKLLSLSEGARKTIDGKFSVSKMAEVFERAVSYATRK